ncbi:UNVERIFIED_CONTAM: hypothetical protein GTU68_027354 [Idotea baltica]|nr:hypothetical protein [Idotea baltica]
MTSQMILVIDNYDSFVHNLARYFRQLGCQTKVVRNDEISIAEIRALNPSAIVLSPGPCTPDKAGICLDVVHEFSQTTPILGICLGHQTIVQAFGGKIVLANEPMHGRSSQVDHLNSPMFAHIKTPFTAGRYHSLVAKSNVVPDEFLVTATTADRTIMAVEHRTRPIVGLQFHPESVLTKGGYQLLANFLSVAGLKPPPQQELESLHRLGESNSNSLRETAYPISDRLSVKPDAGTP